MALLPHSQPTCHLRSVLEELLQACQVPEHSAAADEVCQCSHAQQQAEGSGGAPLGQQEQQRQREQQQHAQQHQVGDAAAAGATQPEASVEAEAGVAAVPHSCPTSEPPHAPQSSSVLCSIPPHRTQAIEGSSHARQLPVPSPLLLRQGQGPQGVDGTHLRQAPPVPKHPQYQHQHQRRHHAANQATLQWAGSLRTPDHGGAEAMRVVPAGMAAVAHKAAAGAQRARLQDEAVLQAAVRGSMREGRGAGDRERALDEALDSLGITPGEGHLMQMCHTRCVALREGHLTGEALFQE